MKVGSTLTSGWKATISVAMSNYIDAGSIIAIATSLGFWQSEFGLTDAAIGMLAAFSANAFGAAIGAILGGPLTDRFGRKFIYTYDLVLYMVGSAAGRVLLQRRDAFHRLFAHRNRGRCRRSRLVDLHRRTGAHRFTGQACGNGAIGMVHRSADRIRAGGRAGAAGVTRQPDHLCASVRGGLHRLVDPPGTARVGDLETIQERTCADRRGPRRARAVLQKGQYHRPAVPVRRLRVLEPGGRPGGNFHAARLCRHRGAANRCTSICCRCSCGPARWRPPTLVLCSLRTGCRGACFMAAELRSELPDGLRWFLRRPAGLRCWRLPSPGEHRRESARRRFTGSGPRNCSRRRIAPARRACFSLPPASPWGCSVRHSRFC